MTDEKAEIRKEIRTRRKAYSSEQIKVMSEEVCRQILRHPYVRKAKTVIAFWPMPDEVDIRDAIKALWTQGKDLFLPRVVSDTEMILCRYEGEASLAAGRYGILEPCGEEEEITTFEGYREGLTEIVMLVPGVAFDIQGHRVGRGKGYYDRFLSGKQIYTLGVCLPFQKLATVPYERHDIIMDGVIG